MSPEDPSPAVAQPGQVTEMPSRVRSESTVFGMDGHRHDWQVDPIAKPTSHPPRHKLVCTVCSAAMDGELVG